MRAKPKTTITHRSQERKTNCFSINLRDVQKIIQKLSKSSSQTLPKREEAAAIFVDNRTLLTSHSTHFLQLDSE